VWRRISRHAPGSRKTQFFEGLHNRLEIARITLRARSFYIRLVL